VSCYGEATIVEVAYQEKAIKEDTSDEPDEAAKSKSESEMQEIKSSLKYLEIKKEKQSQKMEVINKEKTLLEKYANCISDVCIFITFLLLIFKEKA